MCPYRIVVFGGSIGAIDCLRVILANLRVSYLPPFLCVVHCPENFRGMPLSIQKGVSYSQLEAREGDSLQPNAIYWAPGAYHTLVESDAKITFSCDPKQCYCRPSIDVAFRSAAYSFGKRVIGILASGANHDGGIGLQEIKAYEGITIVQSPDSCRFGTMPENALAFVDPDYVENPLGIKNVLCSLIE